MKTGLLSVIGALAFIAAAGISCATGTTDTIAGGTGTGNPPAVSSSVSIVVDTSTLSETLKKMVTGLPFDTDSFIPSFFPPYGPFPVSGDDSLQFTVEKASVLVRRIYFMRENAGDCALPDGFDSPRLDCDTEGIFIDGPFLFNAIDGSCEPRIDSLLIPPARYTGLKLHVSDSLPYHGVVRPDFPADSGVPVMVAGTFAYRDTVHNFTIKLSMNAVYAFPVDESEVSPTGQRADFILAFASRNWLDSVNFAACLLDGGIGFEGNGDLIIDAGTGIGHCMGIAGQIRDNFVNSGRLYIYSR